MDRMASVRSHQLLHRVFCSSVSTLEYTAENQQNLLLVGFPYTEHLPSSRTQVAYFQQSYLFPQYIFRFCKNSWKCFVLQVLPQLQLHLHWSLSKFWYISGMMFQIRLFNDDHDTNLDFPLVDPIPLMLEKEIGERNRSRFGFLREST